MVEDKNVLDLIIVGAGPIGLACGIEAKKANLSYAIIEKGCLVNSLFHYPYNMTFFSTSELLEIGAVPFVSHGHKPTRAEALEYYRRVTTNWQLSLKLYEEVTGVEKTENTFRVTSSRSAYTTRKIIFALGFYDLPYLLNVPGEFLPKVKHYYDEPHPYFGQKVVVVGSSNSAVDVALETWRKGADVTMVIRAGAIGEQVKYWVKPDMENRIKEGSIKVLFNTEIVEITPDAVVVKTPERQQTIENDFVLAMTGYQPPFGFLSKVGISFKDDEARTPSYDEKTMESNIKGIYLAGVVCGGLNTHKWFIENSRVHAEIILKDITQQKR